MKNYSVETVKKKHWIREAKTNFMVAVYTEKKKAEELCAKLNRRGGFEGETPSFFACKCAPA